MLPHRALSLRQPWLHYIVEPGVPVPKRIENRSRRILNWREWDPPGEFWLHAAKDTSAEYWRESVDRIRSVFGLEVPIPESASLARGGIVGRCRIVGMVKPSGELEPTSAPAGDMRWHFPGSHAYVLADVIPVPFVPCRGLQGFFPVPPDVLAQLGKAAA